MSIAASRYARALYMVAEEHKSVAQIQAKLEMFFEEVFSQEDFQKLLPSPAFSKTRQREFLTKFFATVSSDQQNVEIMKILENFLNVLVSHSRLPLLGDITSFFNHLVMKEQDAVVAVVKTASPLQESARQQLQSELKAVTGKEIILREEVVASLLGGVVVRIGSRQIDTSLRTKLNSLKYALKEVD